MGLAGGHRPHPRAIVFDLDRCLIDSRTAWRFCIEEAVASAAGRRVDASSLVDEYHTRPWRDALGILASSSEEARNLAVLCDAMFERSAMKKLLVHEGIGMALHALRGERIEIGAISRLPHGVAVKQIQSTGLDRFVAVLSATLPGEPWVPAARFDVCLAFLATGAPDSAFISGDLRDLDAVAGRGARPFAAGWAHHAGENPGVPVIASPPEMRHTIMRYWATRGL
ncbi:MAG: HAD hydrolase-like protein [Dehalococcoidia bacterium]|uniref:HAD family hydrolase n=1 Tax=Candidatus Amarobacter glycogenicus TaxID=3140699 RepID=UPI003134816A|nr:HAD hydrolase-like protein [Dehalococcoidia bacterium]